MADNSFVKETLLYNMATRDEYLIPLKSFTKRRLYANLLQDFVVPLGTAAILNNKMVSSLRLKYRGDSGFVSTLVSPANADNNIHKDEINHDEDDIHITTMIKSLDLCGWEKIVVNFKTIVPIAHNKLCALERKPDFLFQTLLGFSEGKFVMDNATDFIANLSVTSTFLSSN